MKRNIIFRKKYALKINKKKALHETFLHYTKISAHLQIQGGIKHMGNFLFKKKKQPKVSNEAVFPIKKKILST